MHVGMVERARPGGICLNWGCIPTKALLRSSEIYHLAMNAEKFGIQAENVRFDLPAMVERSRKVAQQLSAGVQSLMRKNKVPSSKAPPACSATAEFRSPKVMPPQNMK